MKKLRFKHMIEEIHRIEKTANTPAYLPYQNRKSHKNRTVYQATKTSFGEKINKRW